MANDHLAYPDLAIDKFSGTDPDHDAESLTQIIARKINFALGDTPGAAVELASYTFSVVLFFTPRTSRCVVREQYYLGECANKIHH